MSLVSSTYGMDSESSFKGWFSGVGRAILGRSSKFNFQRNWNPVNAKVILIDTSFNELMRVAQNVPHLNVVISRGAEMFSNMKIKHKDKAGKEIEGSEILKLLNNPNPLQQLEGFLYEFYVNNAIFSANFGYMNGSGLKKIPKFLWWLPPGYMKINTTGKMYRQTSIEGIVENYMLNFDTEPFLPKEIIHMTEGISDNNLKSSSKIESLQIPLSNIVAGLKSNNIILTERGLIGFISKETSKEMGGDMPLTEQERMRIEKQYQKDRNLDSTNSHVMVTGNSMKWVPMTFDVKQLMLYEGFEDSFGLICGEYGIDRDVFPSIKGATNENKEMGLKATIQNTLQPLGTKLCNVIAQRLGVTEAGETLEATFEHMPVMKEDQLKMEQSEKTKVEKLSILKADGIISEEQYAKLANVEYDGTPTEPAATTPAQ